MVDATRPFPNHSLMPPVGIQVTRTLGPVLIHKPPARQPTSPPALCYAVVVTHCPPDSRLETSLRLGARPSLPEGLLLP